MKLKVSDFKPRNFTASELSDIECHPLSTSDFIWAEDDYVDTQLGDRLTAVGDNLYLIQWAEDNGKGYFTLCTLLAHALQLLAN